MTNIERYESASLQASEIVTKSFSTSFSLGILCLGKKIRKPIYGIYGFVRVADEIVDTFFEVDQSKVLDDFENETYLAIQNKYSSNLILHAFQSVVNTYAISEDLIKSFFLSMRADLSEKNHDSQSYQKYVYGSAEVVGLMCLRVFTNNDKNLYDKLESPAKKLGSAFQKVNFFRDISEDYNEKGRTYFPGFEIDKKLNEKQKSSIENEINSEFEEALKGIYSLPRSSRFGVLLACRYYKKLFKKLKSTPADQLMSKRIRVNNFQKVLLIPTTFVLSLFK